jgi:hypothetical protein
MENINKYIYSLIITSVIAVLAELIIPKGEGAGIGKYVDMISGLCVVIALISPVKAGVDWLLELEADGIGGLVSEHELPDAESYAEAFEMQILDASQEEVRRLICKNFKIDPENIRVSLRFSEEYALQSVSVILRGNGVFVNPAEVTQYVRKTFGCECVVAVE